MPAYRPNPEKLTPQEELGGGIREPWREDNADSSSESEGTGSTPQTARSHRPRSSGLSRRGGRSYPEPSDSELDPEWEGPNRWHTPEEVAVIQAGVGANKQALWREQARRNPYPPDAHFDDVRRGQLLFAADSVSIMKSAEGAGEVMADPEHHAYSGVSRYYRDPEHARARAEELRTQAEELVDTACKNCPFIDRCALAGMSMHVVAVLEDPQVLARFRKEMDAPYGAPFVSCEVPLLNIK